MTMFSRAAGCLVACFALLALTGCPNDAECAGEYYTFAQSPGEVTGSYRGLDFATLQSIDLQSNTDGDAGTLTLSGEGGSPGDDDDSAGGDDDDSARSEGREYEDLVDIDTWTIDIQWEDTRAVGQATDGAYSLKSGGSDCATFGNKCFESQVGFNGEAERERWLRGRLEIFDLAGGLRGCLFLVETAGDVDATLDLYWTD